MTASTTTQLPTAPVALAEGDQMPATTAGPTTRTDFVRYAGASGDFHPLHHDEVYAREARLPGVFGMGLLHAGIPRHLPGPLGRAGQHPALRRPLHQPGLAWRR